MRFQLLHQERRTLLETCGIEERRRRQHCQSRKRGLDVLPELSTTTSNAPSGEEGLQSYPPLQ